MGSLQSKARAAAAAGAALTLVAVGVSTTAGPAAADEVPTAKNVIVLISDGAGYSHFDSANLYETGTTRNQVTVNPLTGEIIAAPQGPAVQVYDDYPVQIAQSHYSANGRAYYDADEAWATFEWVKTGPTDSAAAATALGTGVKTNNGVLGYTPTNEKLTTIGEHALDLGKAVGLVTTVAFDHATPAGFITHNTNRNDYVGLANEMIESGIDVIMGAGHPYYNDDNTMVTPNYKWISQADYDRVSQGLTDYSYVESKADFDALAAGGTVPDKVFGLARVPETLQYNRAGVNDAAHKNIAPYSDPLLTDVPDLATMAEGALNVLERDADGFFLMVEGGAVDWAGHANQTTRLVEEQQDFNAAVEVIDAWVNANSSWDETLVIITADHETGYLSGPGAGTSTGWRPMTGTMNTLPSVTWHSGDHTNSLVPLYAKGVGSELLVARADEWDKVRGAYIDNTDIGKTLFDVFGAAYSGLEATVPLEAAIGLGNLTPGALTLRVATLAAPVKFSEVNGEFQAALPSVVITDTRNDIQARGAGWEVSGKASDFVAGNRVVGAQYLAWAPLISSSENGAAAGSAGAALANPATLAESDAATREGTTIAGANLTFNPPSESDPGRYGSEITLTLFAKD
ncbi:MAG: alkaline phosphatase [Bifidobacteriaceae bacterium]|jgi:alkaline phosphatase|nr:alkaline phosphatase [Bifidobacteriaceae bacterium]